MVATILDQDMQYILDMIMEVASGWDVLGITAVCQHRVQDQLHKLFILIDVHMKDHIYTRGKNKF